MDKDATLLPANGEGNAFTSLLAHPILLDSGQIDHLAGDWMGFQVGHDVLLGNLKDLRGSQGLNRASASVLRGPLIGQGSRPAPSSSSLTFERG